MPYGTEYIDTVTSTGNLTITNSVSASGNLTPQTVTQGSKIIYPLLSGSVVNTTGAVTIQVATGIPSWVKRISLTFSGVSFSTSSIPLVQVGYGATPTWQTTGYVATGENYAAASNTCSTSSSGFPIGTLATIAPWYIVFTLCNSPGTNTWTGSYSGTTATQVAFGGGTVTLSGALTAIRITSPGGTAGFNAGTINIMYE
jgi:hypothetical protein